MTPRVDGTQGNFDNPKKVIHTLTPEEKKAGSIFKEEHHKGAYFTYKDLNNDGLITEDEVQSFTEETYNEKNQLMQVSVLKFDSKSDCNWDRIDKYQYNEDGTASIDRYKDRNGDDYSDEHTHYEYDKQRNLVSKETKTQEDINSIRNREHSDDEIKSRLMAYINGTMMEDSE